MTMHFQTSVWYKNQIIVMNFFTLQLTESFCYWEHWGDFLKATRVWYFLLCLSTNLWLRELQDTKNAHLL